MKKSLFIASAIVVSLLTSCMRNYTCNCTDSNGVVTNTNMQGNRNNCNNRCVASGTNCSLK